MGDVKDILEIEKPNSDGQIFGNSGQQPKKEKPKKLVEPTFKKPEGMHRELYALLYSDKKEVPPIFPSDTSQGYKQMKAKLGLSRVRPWKWMPFTNPARKDGCIFHHWRKAADEGLDYPFSRFNKNVQVPVYSDQEYQMHLHDDRWSRQETDHLFDLCRRFDLRWFVINDRYSQKQHQQKKSIEDLKERYYSIYGKLAKIRADPNMSSRAPPMFDAEHERKRKLQLEKQWNKTSDQVEEEQYLIQELKKIELRKREREKKAQDLQKLITAADSNVDVRKTEKKLAKKKTIPQQKKRESEGGGSTKIPEGAGIKFPDFKQSGVSLRSQRMKLPAAIGQKKTKAIEQLLDELGIPLMPSPTEAICDEFNELRSDMVLLYELKMAHANCEFELESLRHQCQALAPGRDISSLVNLPPFTNTLLPDEKEGSTDALANKRVSEIIDVVGTPVTPIRKRRAAMEQGNILKKLKRN